MSLKVELVGLVFKLIDERLCVLLRKIDNERATAYCLPSVTLGKSRNPEKALFERVSDFDVTLSYAEQLYTFVEERSGIIRIAYVGLAAKSEQASYPSKDGALWTALKLCPKLCDAHIPIKELGVQRLRNKISYSRIATKLLAEEFTLTELMSVYEEILGEPIDKRNFRKKVEAKKLVVPTAAYRYGVHRPARLYRAGPKAKNVPL